MMRSALKSPLLFLLLFACLAQGGVWILLREQQAKWAGVPPLPHSSSALAFGDAQLAYRTTSLMLQNMGNMSGLTTRLRDYDYDALGTWFWLADGLDSRSNATPYLAAYYFSAVQDTQKLAPLVDYLAKVGARPEEANGMKWRWLGQAVFLARYKMKDMERAQSYARTLSHIAATRGDLPLWARNAQAMVATAMGEKDMALGMLLDILKNHADELDPTEVNATAAYICTQILTAQEAQGNALCKGL